jgi:DNA-binding XRE family transcriptional regulator
VPESVWVSPIGSTAEQAAERRAARSAVYRAEHERWSESRELAWRLIGYRMDHQLTQHDLANEVGISYATILRLERGRHNPSPATRGRLAAALGAN